MKYVIDVQDIDRYLLPSETRGSVIGIPMSVDNNKCIIATNIEYIGQYTEPDRKAIEDEVWEFAKKVILGRNDGGLSVREIEDCFGSATYSIGVFQKYSYQEAKEKYDAWKKQKEAIHVGDEVKHKQHGWKAFVTNISEFGYLTLMRGLGESSSGFNLEDFEKTGRHCKEVEKLIKKIKENS